MKLSICQEFDEFELLMIYEEKLIVTSPVYTFIFKILCSQCALDT